MLPKKPPDEQFSHSETADSGLIVHCGLRAPQKDSICDELHAHLLVMPDNSCEAEFCWRVSDGSIKTLWLEGRRVIFIPKNTPYEIIWKKTAAFVRMALSDAFIFGDAAIQKQLVSVQIRHEWQLASEEQLLHFLFKKFTEQCRHIEFPNTSRYVEKASYLYAVDALKILAANEIVSSSGLTFPRLKKVLAYVDQNLSERIYVADLAREAGMCAQYFTKLFKVSTGLTPHRYIYTKRVERAQELLDEKKMRVADVAAAVGFCDESYLWHSLKQFFAEEKQEARISPEKQ